MKNHSCKTAIQKVFSVFLCSFLSLISITGISSVQAFANTQYTISASVAGDSAGGHLSPAGNVLVDEGATQKFNITANEGYVIQSVVVDSADQGAISEYSFENVAANHTITVTFTPASESTATFTYIVDGGEAYITGISSSSENLDLVIPETIDEYTVVGIDASAFKGNTDIVSVTMPSTVTSIGGDAFSSCTSLKKVTFSENLNSLGTAAFYNCTSLTQVSLPKKLAGNLQNSVFQNCTSLTSVNIPAGITSINGWAFCGCTSLSEVMFNGVSKLTNIDRQAFSGCTSLTSIEIPKTFSSISYDSFKGCTALTDVYFMGDVSGVTFINWGDVKYSGFYDCQNVTFHAFNDYYKDNFKAYIDAGEGRGFKFEALDGSYFVAEDGNAYKYTIDGGAAIIEGVSLTGSTDMVIPSKINGYDVIEIGDAAFKAMGDSVLAEDPIHPYTDITSVVIPQTVKAIGKNAFYACTSIKTIDIPESVTAIQSGAFCFCTSLESIKLPSKLIGSLGDVMFWGCYNLESVNIPEGITSIGRWVFYDCRKLTEIVIPAAVKSIDKESFEQCISLEKVTFAEGSQCTSIGQQVFWNDPKLTEINLPETLSFIGVEAFRNCSGLKSLDIPASVTSIGTGAFRGCKALETIKFEGDYNYVDEKVLSDCESLKDVWFYGDASSIGFHRLALEHVNDVTFHAYDDKAAALKNYVDRYADERGFSFMAIVSATGVSLDKTNITLNTGEKIQLKAAVAPETAANKNVTWKVSDENVAQVSSDGTVTALAYGKTTVTAVTEDGGFAATCTVQTRFYDVTESQVTSGAITSGEFERAYWAADMGIVRGKKDANGTAYFDRVGDTTRAQMAVMLYRLAKIIDPSAAAKALEKGKLSTKFTDLDGISQGAVEGIYWAVGAGITKGYTEADGTVTYRPNNSISRASTIIMLYRMAGKPAVTAASTGFKDVDGILNQSTDTYKAVAWAKTTGITSGVNQANNTVIFDRVSNIQRRQMVTFIYRYYTKIAK